MADGESEAEAKYSLQLAKALANESRKSAALAVATNASEASGGTAPRAKAKAKAEPRPSPSAVEGPNQGYYSELQACEQAILAEFPGLELESPLPLHSAADFVDAAAAGVQDPFDAGKARVALSLHGVYRCSVSLWSLNTKASPTPDIPMSMRRVSDMASYFYGEDGSKPAFMTGKQIEVMACDANSVAASRLQMVSPEELAHSMIIGCSNALKLLGLLR